MNPDQWQPDDTGNSYVYELGDELPGDWVLEAFHRRVSDDRAAFKLVARQNVPSGREVVVSLEATREYLSLKPWRPDNTMIDGLWAELSYSLRRELRALGILHTAPSPYRRR